MQLMWRSVLQGSWWARATLALAALASGTGAAARPDGDCAVRLDPTASAKFTNISALCPSRVEDVGTASAVVAAAEAQLPSTPDIVAVPFARFEPQQRPVVRLPVSPSRLNGLVAAVATRHRIDPLLLDAIIARESAGRPAAVSAKGALGLMQVMPATGRALGVESTHALRDPAVNLVAGATYLKQMQARFGNDLALTLAAYNAGPGAVARHGAVPPYAETRAYVADILARYAAARQGMAK